MKFHNYDIVFQEVPDEVTLAVNLTGCPNRCEGCHSPHLRDDIGQPLTTEVLDALIATYQGTITCVCFMGGDGDKAGVAALARHLRTRTQLKVAWYSGQEEIPNCLECFDFVKLGGYMPERGGLKSRTTNQRLYRIVEGKTVDITERFWR